MITLHDNKLEFVFPEIASELWHLATEETKRVAVNFLTEDRGAAFKTIVSDHHKKLLNAFFLPPGVKPPELTPLQTGITEEYKATVSEILLSLTSDILEKAITKYVERRARFNFNPDAKIKPTATISFQRTLRIPDDGKMYPLPPSLGDFPLVHVDDHARNAPSSWSKRGGVMMPMYQAEALWLSFQESFYYSTYPCAVKVGTGKINAVSGKTWSAGLTHRPQDYLVLPEQRWLDGYCVEAGYIRQFIAMPLGQGYSVEEQVSGEAAHGGLQVQAYPLKAAVYFDENVKPIFPASLAVLLPLILPEPVIDKKIESCLFSVKACPSAIVSSEMGLAAGGKMRQEIYKDSRPLSDWDQEVTSRCFVHLCNSAVWKQITGLNPPHTPVTAQEYTDHDLPWFDYYREDLDIVEGSSILNKIKTVKQLSAIGGDQPLLDNETVQPNHVIHYGDSRRATEVREWKEDTTTD